MVRWWREEQRCEKVPVPKPKMNPDEVDTDAPLVTRLIATQFPQWRHLPLTEVRSAGTDNTIYRLGGDLAVRLPRRPGAVADVARQQR
jgi:aminoglycoside phosphotransferase (APT) family kinase protein